MKKKFMLLLMIILITGCGKQSGCPKDYNYDEEREKCVKITTREADLETYCKEKFTLEGDRCVRELISEPQVTYGCPDGYYQFGNECRIGVVDKTKCGDNQGYIDGECRPYEIVTQIYKCDVQSNLKKDKCIRRIFEVPYTKYTCKEHEEVVGGICKITDIVNPD